ncbi:cyclic nucleotide-binding domain-containing protein [Gordonia sp. HNM0687]|uniref:histidine kinase n=1 Tax=Gordonia mangrovi TaxID=2665643 RepID=A0A6L7GUT9_9ACTN|nr:ATP-binding protein [Gordonia mangrovi]MXP22298.1 cyclic nucleotide-binding domain-containing protein [Gordonia mangrovi]UVF77808.1 ATP-binding protein [Gordonia mangrovi]
MSRPEKHLGLAEQFFGDDARTQRLAPGEALMRAGEPNTRLYLVLRGELRCEGEDEQGVWRELFVLRSGDLAGVTSFFGRPHTSVYDMVAMSEVSVAYLDRVEIPPERKESVDASLVPLVVHALHRRDVQRSELERMLGVAQFGAGIAHELNNTLAVALQGWSWLDRVVSQRLLQGRSAEVVDAFTAGRAEHPHPSSAQVRRRARELAGRYGWGESFARRWARAGLPAPEAGQNTADMLEFFEIGEALADATSAIGHTRHVLDQMHALGQRRQQHTSTFDIATSVDAGLGLVRHLLSGVDVEVISEPEILVHCDRLQLDQVWANLARNAANALRAPGLTEPPRLRIECDIATGMARVRMTDNGPGIDPEILPEIFSPQVTDAPGRTSMGLGLGLSLARSVVTAYGGMIGASNVSPHGAQLEVRLPLAQPTGDRPAPNPTNGAPS